MRNFVLAWLLAATAQAAVIRGVVLENLSSKPLARAMVTLQPVAGTPGEVQSLRANRLGSFDFDRLPAGTYVVKASRTGFMPMEYGQKRWNSAGTPVVMPEDGSAFLSIRLLRYSAIEGTVRDENDVGMPDHDVVAYRNSKPLQVLAQAVTDDRGVYRLRGLEPGTYVVRAAGKRYEDETYLPAFGRDAEELEQARTVDLSPELDGENADVRPFPGGRLFTLSVKTESFPPDVIPLVTLASELGRKTVPVPDGVTYPFPNLPPGYYDVYAEVADPKSGGAILAAYQRVLLGRELSVTLLAQRACEVTIAGAPAEDAGKLWIRRKDLAGVGTPLQAVVARGRTSLPAGRWELLLQPPPGYYVADFSQLGNQGSGRADGWNEAVAGAYTRFRFTVSSGPGAIRGVVKSSGDPVSSVPVYLEGYDQATRARVGELRITRTDARGQYYLTDLAPGSYRILGTFEYLAPDLQTMDAAGAQVVTVNAHGELPLDLDLYVIR